MRRNLLILIAAFAIALLSGGRPPKSSHPGVPAHGISEKGLDRRTRAGELWFRHQLNLQRIGKGRAAAAIGPGISNSDIADIAVLQDDGSVIIPPNPFDLNGRAVLFSPSGNGYVASVSSAGFDADLGQELDLTSAPAVNPKPSVEPGDDAYVVQDLGFSFTFFGAVYNSVAVTSNGNLCFQTPRMSQLGFDLAAVAPIESLFVLASGPPRIAPFWHDLDGRAAQTAGASGVWLRRDADRIVITWNTLRDFPNDPGTDRGIHTFQATLFRDWRILFTYSTAQLTSTALAGLSPGGRTSLPVIVDLANPSGGALAGTSAEFFTLNQQIDIIGAVEAFYFTHPGRDVYDFLYLVTDFEVDLDDAFAFYLPITNDAEGIGQPIGEFSPALDLSATRIQGILNLGAINSSYPDFPTRRFLDSNHALSIMGQEQGHRWMSFINYPGSNPLLLLGRDNAHWSFFYSIESTTSTPAAPRSSSMEGNVWRENANGSFTSIGLIDGYSRLDQYLMGFRPASDVTPTFVITAPSGAGGLSRSSSPRPNVTVGGIRREVTLGEIVQENQVRSPGPATSQKQFRAAVVLLTRGQPAGALIDKITRYRLAWESYFAQSTDFLATINTGLADAGVSRVIAAVSAASYGPALSPAGIGALFGEGLTGGVTESATSLPLPASLAGVEVRIDGVLAPLYAASPTQINFQVPRATVSQTLTPPLPSATSLVEVFRNGTLIRAGAFQIAASTPAIFTLDLSGSGPAAAVDAFTGALAPFNARRADGSANILAVFGTGLGSDATDVDGNASASSDATIDGAPANVTYAGRAPGFAGLNQWNVVLTDGITAGTHTLVIRRNGIASQPVTI
ncbi:MAG: hypothetical protein ACRD44_12480, partial [Bryobacteraceae bacterium]